MDSEDPDNDPNSSENVITSSFYQFEDILKILSKSVHKFFSYPVHNKQTDGQTDKLRRKHNLLGGDNK